VQWWGGGVEERRVKYEKIKSNSSTAGSLSPLWHWSIFSSSLLGI
jgi:hypothetical protein